MELARSLRRIAIYLENSLNRVGASPNRSFAISWSKAGTDSVSGLESHSDAPGVIPGHSWRILRSADQLRLALRHLVPSLSYSPTRK
jgi:hypothetical protein